MNKQFQVYAGSPPEELIAGFEPTVYNMEVKLRDSAVEYSDASLPSNEIRNQVEIMKKNALDKAIQLYAGNLTTDNKFSEDDRLEISDLEGRCTGVMVTKKPEIKPGTLWLANFGIRNDTLHYGSEAVSGVNQTPKGVINIEFIGYSK